MKKLLAVTLLLSLALSMAGCCCVNIPKDILEKYYVKEPHYVEVPSESEPLETEPAAPAVSQENPYYDCYQNHTDYVLPGSDSTYFGRADIANLSDEEREIAKQEIYARHGRSFSDPNLQEYFTARSWYVPGAETELNDCEEDNLFLLDVFQKQQTGEIRSSRYIRQMRDPSYYAMADSDSRYLRASDLSNLEHDYLVVVRNEIFARHGFIFGSENLKTYFYCTDWYRPNPNFSNKDFNKYEQANVTLCELYERKLEGVKFSSKNPYKGYYYGTDTQIISYSSNQYLSDFDLWYMSEEELTLARNEILARNGYTFESENLLEFFLQCDWYKPDSPPGNTGSLGLSKIENANIELIKDMEEYLENGGTWEVG